MKCMPINLSGREAEDNSVIEIDEVFEAKIESSLTIWLISLNILNLACLFSNIASITKSVSGGIFYTCNLIYS